MISADELMKSVEIPLDQQILRIVAEHEPIKRYQIADHCQTSRDRVAILGRISEMRKASLLDIGDAEEGYIVMLTPEGREALSGFELLETGGAEQPTAESENESAGAPPDPGNGKKSLLRRVVDFLILHPGSTRDQLKKQFPDELKGLSVALCDGRKNGRITMRKEWGVDTFHLGPNTLEKLASNRKPSKEKHRLHASPAVLSTVGTRLDTKPAERNSEAGHATLALSPAGEKALLDEARRDGETYMLPTGWGIPAEPEKTPPGRFRVARTSDKTLIIWGISQAPIELDAAQSRTLIDFIFHGGVLR